MAAVDRKPKWTVWANVPTVKAWEAVALSLDIDPKAVRLQKHAWMAGGGGGFPHEEGESFEERLEVVRRNLGQAHGLQPAAIVMGEPERCEIYLSGFVRWALGLNWTIPEELKRAGAQQAPAEIVATRERPQKAAAEPQQKQVPVAPPEKLTSAWLWNHMPVSWWWWLIGGAAVVFMAGVAVGQSELYDSLVARPKRAVSSEDPTPRTAGKNETTLPAKKTP